MLQSHLKLSPRFHHSCGCEQNRARPRPLELLSSASVVEGLGAESIAHLYIAKHETKEGERQKVYFIDLECPNSCWRIWYGPQLHGFVVL